MKTTTALSILLLASLVSAHSFVVESTNVVHITFQDSTLSDAQRDWIGADLLRIISPGLSRTSLVFETNAVPKTGQLRRLYTQPDLVVPHGLPKIIFVSGTNLTLEITKSYTDCYLERTAFFATHSNAIAQAFAFTQSLISNPAATRTDSAINAVYLMKSHAPGAIPALEIAELRSGNLDAGLLSPPSLLSFQMIPYGPGGGTYLWCFPPLRRDIGVYRQSFIYYNEKWWMSTWLDEESEGVEQQW